MLKIQSFLAFKLSDVVFIMLINVKMPTIVGILTFMSLINFMHGQVAHEKSLKTTKPGPLLESELHYFQFLIMEVAIFNPLYSDGISHTY